MRRIAGNVRGLYRDRKNLERICARVQGRNEQASGFNSFGFVEPRKKTPDKIKIWRAQTVGVGIADVKCVDSAVDGVESKHNRKNNRVHDVSTDEGRYILQEKNFGNVGNDDADDKFFFGVVGGI